ncbi:hypothetical protein C1H46_001448 [Malus baccata]|uniref:O-methyltransferase C-terminal domain-containing protein n=1 Tax=Malus baccata TaxID=106549 RepID=A0A540NP46_MALBA|nr:hypothetical protein C1H46_001448 [Malus baccata]
MSTVNGEEEADSQYAMQLANISVLPMVLKVAIELVLEGGLAFNKAYGMNVVDYIGRDDRLGSVFKDSMKEFNLIFKKEIMEIYTRLKGLRTLVDVDGGDGTIPNYDLPSVVEKSPSHPRIEHIARDMFVRIPKGDAIFMKDDDLCLMILKNCYEALPDNGKVIVVDMVIQ